MVNIATPQSVSCVTSLTGALTDKISVTALLGNIMGTFKYANSVTNLTGAKTILQCCYCDVTLTSDVLRLRVVVIPYNTKVT